MATLTAETLVRRCRELVQLFEGEAVAYRDGFPDDSIPTGETPTPMLSIINEFVVGRLSRQRFKWATITPSAPVGAVPFRLPTIVVYMRSLYYSGNSLKQYSREFLDKKNRDWQAFAGVPNGYVKEGRDIYAYPITAAAGTLTARCAVAETALVNRGDTFDSIPDDICYLLPYGAAVYHLGIDADHGSNQKRFDIYKENYQYIVERLSAMDESDSADFGTPTSLDNFKQQVSADRARKGS